LRYPAGALAHRLSLLRKFAPAPLLDKGIRKANKLTSAPKANHKHSPQQAPVGI
jgi:hypothetical protein